MNRPELVEETNQFGKDWKIPIHLPICKRNAYACKFWIRSGALSTCNGYGQQQNKYYTFFCRRRRCAHWNSLQDLYFISENRQHTIFFIEILPSCEGGEVVDEDNMRTKRQQIYDSDICIMYNGTITSNCSSLRQPILSFSARGREQHTSASSLSRVFSILQMKYVRWCVRINFIYYYSAWPPRASSPIRTDKLWAAHWLRVFYAGVDFIKFKSDVKSQTPIYPLTTAKRLWTRTYALRSARLKYDFVILHTCMHHVWRFAGHYVDARSKYISISRRV